MEEFEWDENKRTANLVKHSIDFVDAIHVFDDYDRIEAESTRKGERRIQTIGQVSDVIMFVVYVERDKKKRIISARKASQIERETYYENQQDD